MCCVVSICDKKCALCIFHPLSTLSHLHAAKGFDTPRVLIGALYYAARLLWAAKNIFTTRSKLAAIQH